VFNDSRVSEYLIKTSKAQLWHKRLRHKNFDIMIKIRKIGAVKGLPRFSRPGKTICMSCHFGKQTRTHFKSKEFFSSISLELIHTDICGANRTKPSKR